MVGEPGVSPLWPADNPAVIAHISMLQGIINRLANNSAACKTWCLAIVSALLSLAGTAHLPGLVGIAVLPVMVFGYLDAMYLAQEQAYRTLFSAVVESVRSGRYAIGQVYAAQAPLGSGALLAALRSWSVYPVYAGLLLAYGVAAQQGWIGLIAERSGR